jgi:DNA-binding IclR family transcriptional regulator
MANDHLSELMALAGRLIDGEQQGGVREHALAMGLPLSTAHRHVAALVNGGMVQRTARGRYCPGPSLLALAGRIDLHASLAALARPVLRDLAAALHCSAHLGVLENQMVSYLAKAGNDPQIFSREGLQLEAYCSAVGKILLAALPPATLDAYLAEGGFVALTPHTKVLPDLIAQELAETRERGFALDRQEIAEGLNCVALPIVGPNGHICAAISVSSFGWSLDEATQARILQEMQPRVTALSQQIGAPS